jgi:hypothetical protein
MNKIFILLIILLSNIFANSFSIDIQKPFNQEFANNIIRSHSFKESSDANATNIVGIEAINIKQKVNPTSINLNGNFNDMIGFSYSKCNIHHNSSIYVGTNSIQYLRYRRAKSSIDFTPNYNYNYQVKKDDPVLDYTIQSTNIKNDTTEYTFLNILTYSKSDIKETSKEDHNGTASTVHSSYTLEKTILSTENLYDMVKEDTINNKDYFYPIAISKNINSYFRIYGVAIFSYEHYDYSNIQGYNDSNNTESIYVKGDAEQLADGLLLKGTGEGDAYESSIPGKFKGFGLGYKLTAEAYVNNFSFFLTAYYKRLNLKNYHVGISKKLSTANSPSHLVANEKLVFVDKYAIFGLRYTF